MGALRPVLASLLVLALGCSPSTEESGFDTVSPITPPALLSVLNTTPGHAETGITRHENIVITFDKAVKSTSVGASTIKFVSSFGPVAGAYLVQGATVTFNPAQALPASGPIQATVTTQVLGTDNSHLAQEFSWTFGTEHYPQAIASGASLQQARIAASAEGLVLAMWVQNDNGTHRLFSRAWRAATGWNPTTEFSVPGVAISHLKVICTENNVAIAVWTEGAAAPYSFKTARFVAGTGWSAIQTLSNAGAFANLYFAVHRQGWGGAGYRTSASTTGFRYLEANGNWGDETTVGPDVLNYSLSAGANGQLFTSFSVYNELLYAPYYGSRYAPGAGWTTEEIFNGSALEEYGTGDNPAGGLAYFSGAGGTLVYRYDGVDWSTHGVVNGPDRSTLSTSLSTTPGGLSCLAWTIESESEGGSPDLMAAYLDAGGDVVEMNTLESLDTPTGNPIATFLDDGESWIFYSQADAGAESIWRARFVPGSGWQTAEELDEDDMTASGLRAAAQGSGGAAAWFRANTATELMVLILD